MKINEKGRSMIEMLGVLAIIGVLSVGGIAGYAKAMAKFRANKTIDLVSHTVANTRILFGSQVDYADLKTDWNADVQKMAKNAKLFPDEVMRTSGSGNNASASFENAYAGKVALAEGDRLSAGDHKAFVIALNGLPQSACIDLATQDWAASSGSGFVAMEVVGQNLDMATAVGKLNNDANKLLNSCTSTESSGADGDAVLCAKDGKPMSTLVATFACKDPNTNTLVFKFY